MSKSKNDIWIDMSDYTSINLDTTTIDDSTITISANCESLYNSMSSTSTFDISSITVDTVDLSGIVDDSDYTITWGVEEVEFEDKMPSVAKIEDMCNDYPALAKAYENFKSIYALVHQDWKGRQDDDDEIPF